MADKPEVEITHPQSSVDMSPVSFGNFELSEQVDQDSSPALTEDSGNPELSNKSNSSDHRGSVVREVIETALIAILIFVGVRSLILNFKVDGSSMVPSLVNGEMLLVNKNAYEEFDLYSLVDWLPGVEHASAKEFQPFSGPDRGDVVVFDPPVPSDKPYIKRVIGLPGEMVEIKDGSVFINGQRLDEPYIDGATTDCSPRACDPIVVPEDHVFLLGDNRSNSSDSRYFGTVAIDEILGKALVTYWPIDHLGRVPASDYDEIHDQPN
jgi:signal peptidase I